MRAENEGIPGEKLKRVVIVGGGPAGLMAATQLLKSDCEILLLDRKASVGRKFLVAGDGGFNLTHSENKLELIEKYDSEWIKQAVRQFSNKDFIINSLEYLLDEVGVIEARGKDIKPQAVPNKVEAVAERLGLSKK